MKYISANDFEDKFEYAEGSSLRNNPNFVIVIDDNDRCFYFPKNFNTSVLEDINLAWFKQNNITFRRILDVGAGIGDDAAALSEISNIIESFEIGQESFECLVANLEIAAGTYAQGKIFNKHHVAITNSNNYSIEIAEYLNKPHLNKVAHLGDFFHERQYLVEEPTNYVLLKQSTIDNYNFQDVDFIKINVNGFELKVLEGAIETIKRCSPYIYVNLSEDQLIRYSDSTKDVINLLNDLGYSKVSTNIFSK